MIWRISVELPRALELGGAIHCSPSSQRTHDVYNIRDWIAPLAISTVSQQDDREHSGFRIE